MVIKCIYGLSEQFNELEIVHAVDRHLCLSNKLVKDICID